MFTDPNMRDSGVVGNARPCQGRDRGFEPRLSLSKSLDFLGFFYFIEKYKFGKKMGTIVLNM